MTTKTTISFTDRHHQYAREKVKEGSYASVSSFVAASLEQAIQEEQERDAALEAMKETIQRRMQTPRAEWIDHQPENDPMFERVRRRLAVAHEA